MRKFLHCLLPSPTSTLHVGEPPPGVYLEEGHAGASMDRAILDGGLVSQVVHGLDGHFHTLHSQEGGQVGRVRGDDDEGERPPMQEETRKASRPGHSQEACTPESHRAMTRENTNVFL